MPVNKLCRIGSLGRWMVLDVLDGFISSQGYLYFDISGCKVSYQHQNQSRILPGVHGGTRVQG